MDGFTAFKDRSEAGQRLANQLIHYRNDPNTLVLALPRGGVPIAYQVAKKLHLPLDIFVVRKLGVPFHEELAMGAIASGDAVFFNEDVIANLGPTKNDIKRVIEKEKTELQRREKKYRGGRAFPAIAGKKIILIDDGIATGASIHSAIIALKKLSAQKIIIAVPVAPESTVSELKPLVDEIVCLHSAAIFYGVGQFYHDFSQTTDEEVINLLSKIGKRQ